MQGAHSLCCIRAEPIANRHPLLLLPKQFFIMVTVVFQLIQLIFHHISIYHWNSHLLVHIPLLWSYHWVSLVFPRLGLLMILWHPTLPPCLFNILPYIFLLIMCCSSFSLEGAWIVTSFPASPKMASFRPTVPSHAFRFLTRYTKSPRWGENYW